MKKKNPIIFSFQSKNYPTDPGCYLMKDKAGRIIYVGKAKNLRRRLGSYFNKSKKNHRIKSLVSNIAGIEVILLNNENESLFLENNLIKLHKPRYNRALMQDDVGYPFIILTGEKYPRLLPYRRNRFNKQWERTKGKEEGIRFGPFLYIDFRNAVFDFAVERFKLRTCNPIPNKVCIRYNFGKCSGICESKITPEDYARAVKQTVALLSYRFNYADLVNHLRARMSELSEHLEFEKAKILRDQIVAIESVLEKQIVEQDVKYDQDVIWFEDHYALVMKLKLGMVQSVNFFCFDKTLDHVKSREDFLLSNYKKECPKELIINELEKPAIIEKALSSQNQDNISISIPKKGIKNELLLLCRKNFMYRKSAIQN
jgi:excinuclease ABC subunit C